MPGKYWYFGTAFAADADPNFQIATASGDKWTANYAAKADALAKWQTLVKTYSKADPNGDEAKQDAAMAAGNIAMIYGNGWEEGVVSGPKNSGGNPALADQLGVFPMPSAAKPDSTDVMPSFVGGSDLAVPSKSANQAAAWQWIKAYTGTTAMGLIAKAGAIPNNTAQIGARQGRPGSEDGGNPHLVRADRAELEQCGERRHTAGPVLQDRERYGAGNRCCGC